MVRRIARLLSDAGYRFCQAKPEEAAIYYKFYQEGFHVCLVVDCQNGFTMTPEVHDKIEENVMNLFYHPEGRLQDFPQGLPVYHVEVMTILVGSNTNMLHALCANCKNTWAVLTNERKLLIYENQPGDFFGIRAGLEDLVYGAAGETGGHSDYGTYTTNHQASSWKEKLMSANWKNLSFVTIGIMVTNIVVFMIMELLGSTTDVSFMATYGALFPPFILYGGQWWRLLTSMFLHFGAAHLLNNMVIFGCVGSRLEKAMGHWKFAVVYLISGIGAGLFSMLMMILENQFAVAAGASGAIFGVIGGMIWVLIRNRGRFEGLTGRGMVLMAVLCLYYGFSTAGIDNWSHIGGLVTGFIAAILFYRRKSQKD